ncbi:MAG TPA: class I SAM-dependent methyltransferase [Gemmataceae bacterium]|nr:class I SAM-dependent methyltransferase [Gemmataceae bacterium]
MEYRTADARKEFDRWSWRYDWDLLQPLFFRPSHRMMLDTLGPADVRILDIGCGTGKFAARALMHFPNAQIWGLDLSDGMLQRAGARAQDFGGRLHLVRGDSQRLPFADDSFDAVTCSHSFHHYPQQARVLAEIHRVLRPDGRLLLVDGDRDRLWGWFVFEVLVVLIEGAVRHRTSADLRQLYGSVGFVDVTQRRRKGPLPFLMTVGRAAKALSTIPARHAA